MNLPPTARNVYHGSDGDATRALYARLEALGPSGRIAVNLFRACKSSERAKVYRGGVRGGGSYRSMAYGRKEWSLGNLVETLQQEAAALSIRYGWQEDPATPVYSWVLYVELPTPFGQVSFHASRRGAGPDYPGCWDGVRGASAERVIVWCEHLLMAGDLLEGSA